jgi:hypothetical protein
LEKKTKKKLEPERFPLISKVEKKNPQEPVVLNKIKEPPNMG